MMPHRTIATITENAAERFGDQLAVADGDTRISFTQLFEQARAFGASLVASGIDPGDRISIWCFNCVEWIVAALGGWQAGAVLVPINTRFKGREAADILGRSGARLLVTTTDFLGNDYVELLQGCGVQLPELRSVVVARGPTAAGGEAWLDFLARASASDLATVDQLRAGGAEDAASDILFTSGTTGAPKGVVSTHDRTLTVATDWVAMTELREGDVYLQINPYFHMFGLKAGILASVCAGVTMLPEPVFDVRRALERVEAEGVTVLPGAPTLYQSILDFPDRDRYNVSSLRVGTIGAADIPVELVRRILVELPYSLLISGYGLTEAGTAVGTGPVDDAETIATTVGRPRPSFELRLVDLKGVDVAGGETGEILVRGPSVMLEYLDDPAGTREALSDDGWLRTGDLGRLTGTGCLQIVGRVKDMFIVGGFNAYPAEIENALLRHPDVAQAAVVGIPDHRLGEVGMAFIVARPGSTLDADSLVAWARDQVANYKVPRVVEFLGELPLNATGKVAKEVLRRRAGAAST